MSLFLLKRLRLIIKKVQDDFENTFKNIYVYINRLVKENKLSQFIKGIYYKPEKGVFGNKPLNINKVIEKNIYDENGTKGYFTGAYLFNKIGLTTQVPKEILIATNECPNANDYNNKNLGVTIRKLKTLINDDNYKYLQLFDILINKDNIKIKDFNYMQFKFNDELINAFERIQRIYVLDDESILTIDEVENTIKILFEIFNDL